MKGKHLICLEVAEESASFAAFGAYVIKRVRL